MAQVDHLGGDVAEAVDAEQGAVIGADDQLEQTSVPGDRPTCGEGQVAAADRRRRCRRRAPPPRSPRRWRPRAGRRRRCWRSGRPPRRTSARRRGPPPHAPAASRTRRAQGRPRPPPRRSPERSSGRSGRRRSVRGHRAGRRPPRARGPSVLGVRPVANSTASVVRTAPVERVTVSRPSFRRTVLRVGAQDQPDTAPLELLGRQLGQFTVDGRQEAIGTADERRRDAERGEHRGELNPDRPTTDDDDVLGDRAERVDLVGVVDVGIVERDAREVRRAGPCRHQDRACRQLGARLRRAR